MPADYPDFPDRERIVAWLQAYAEHFGLLSHIRFGTGVTRATRTPDGRWQVTLSTGETRAYDALVVANGHHWSPKWPEIPGRFDGRELHARDYRSPEGFEGRRVVVLGAGSSAMDIAAELSRVARSVHLAARTGVYVLPHRVFGRPIDNRVPPLSWEVRRLLLDALVHLVVGRPERLGLPTPPQRPGRARTVISSEIHGLLRDRRVVPCAGLAERLGDRVRCSDGSEVPADTLIYATGYELRHEFLDPDTLRLVDGALPTWRHVFHVEQPGLCFVGLVQPFGPMPPIAEAQARWIAAHLAGRRPLPDPDVMRKDIAEDAALRVRRHPGLADPLQVDFDEYLQWLRDATTRGQIAHARRWWA